MGHSTSPADAVIGGMFLVALLFWAWLAIMAIVVPFAVFSVVNSLRHIRRSLERLTDAAADAPPARGAIIGLTTATPARSVVAR